MLITLLRKNGFANRLKDVLQLSPGRDHTPLSSWGSLYSLIFDPISGLSQRPG